MVNKALNNPLERAEDPSTTRDTSATLSLSSPPIAHSTSKRSYVRTALGSNILKQGAARTSIRAATIVCKKRLRSAVLKEEETETFNQATFRPFGLFHFPRYYLNPTRRFSQGNKDRTPRIRMRY
ncbi:hypothetical protein N7507_005002 [Penicillium longicatenatum]|nr:hypothetical protein N7507_005002 [Penicillium longicatenatum]